MSTIKNKNNKKINFCVYFLNLVQKCLCIPKICSTFAAENSRKSVNNSEKVARKSVNVLIINAICIDERLKMN